jgi:hypothetical protein
MFGFTKLTPEERIKRDTKLRIKELDTLITGEMFKRAKSLEMSKTLRDELEKLLN